MTRSAGSHKVFALISPFGIPSPSPKRYQLTSEEKENATSQDPDTSKFMKKSKLSRRASKKKRIVRCKKNARYSTSISYEKMLNVESSNMMAKDQG